MTEVLGFARTKIRQFAIQQTECKIDNAGMTYFDLTQIIHLAVIPAKAGIQS
jgi:hypothetical protein